MYHQMSDQSREIGRWPAVILCSATMQARSAFIARQKMGRMGSPEEIASMFVYLASDEVSHIIIYICYTAIIKNLFALCSLHSSLEQSLSSMVDGACELL